MTDDLDRYLCARPATADHPFLGLTFLVVEDSRFASEALRLICQRLGARIRRADCLHSARRHLQTYRPGVVIADMGLPDGCGADLLRHLNEKRRPRPALIGLSADPDMAAQAYDAGADGFLTKPLESVEGFRRVIQRALPAGDLATLPCRKEDDGIHPDRLALRDDLARAARLLEADDSADRQTGYVARFLMGLGRATHDADLQAVARDLGTGVPGAATIRRASGIVQQRIAAGLAI